MREGLARAMDELGLGQLVRGFIQTVHHHPSPEALTPWLAPHRWLSPRHRHPAPPPVSVHLVLSGEHRDCTTLDLTFPSPSSTPFAEDRLARATLFRTQHGPPRGTVIALHGAFLGVQPGGADLRPYLKWATELNRAGLNFLLYALPRHLARTPAGTFSGERFLNGNLLEALECIGQAVSELEALVGWLLENGYGPLGLLAKSLGGLTAVQLLSVCDGFQAALLLAPVPDTTWALLESVLGQAFKPDWLSGGCSTDQLRQVFSPLEPPYCPPLLTPDRIRLVAGRFDEVVLPAQVARMADCWKCPMQEVDEGHLGLITSNSLRQEGTRFFVASLHTTSP